MLEKSKYSKAEVEKLLTDLSFEYENKLIEQKTQIRRLTDENTSLKEKLKNNIEFVEANKASNTDLLNAINSLKKIIEDKNPDFNPKKIIDDYVAVSSENGFDLNQVNDTTIKLEDVCKDLGLIDED